MGTEIIERPLPRPTSEDYINARLLESLIEAKLSLEFLGRGLVRDASGKVFQAWRALLAALLRLELDKLLQVAETDEEKKWLVNRAVPRVPTTKMVRLSQMLEEISHNNILAWTTVALELHDYQYNGPDPDMALSKFRDRHEAAIVMVSLIKELVNRIEKLKPRVKWSNELEKEYEELKRTLTSS